MDLNTLSLDDLKQLHKDAEKAIKTFETRRLAEARAKLEDYAREMGVRLEEVMGNVKGKTKPEGVPKYRHPENPSQTWTGRGRKPDWFKLAIQNGVDEAELRI